jgi:hypothetical protein
LVSVIDDKTRIGHLNCGPHRTGNLLQGDATVNRQPLALVPKQIEIHADFSTSTEREKHNIRLRRLAHGLTLYLTKTYQL